jgi:hypothetical protein
VRHYHVSAFISRWLEHESDPVTSVSHVLFALRQDSHLDFAFAALVCVSSEFELNLNWPEAKSDFIVPVVAKCRNQLSTHRNYGLS